MTDEVKIDDQEAKFGSTPDQVLRINDPYRYQGTPDAKLEIKTTEGQDVAGLRLECSIEKIMPGLSFHDSDGQIICQISPEGEITGDIRDVLTSLELGFNGLSPLWKIIKRLVQERDEARDLLDAAIRLLKHHGYNWCCNPQLRQCGYFIEGEYAGPKLMDLVKLEAERHARASHGDAG